MAGHPSAPLLPTFSHDEMRVELVPTIMASGARVGLGIASVMMLGVVGLPAVLGDPDVTLAMGTIFVPMIGVLGLITTLGNRRIQVVLRANQLEIRWMWGQRQTSRRSYDLSAVRTVYAVPASGQGQQQKIRVVTDTEEQWLEAQGVPFESLVWLADEINQAADQAKEHRPEGPPPELQALLRPETREVKARLARQARPTTEGR